MKQTAAIFISILLIFSLCLPVFAAGERIDLDAKGAVLIDMNTGKVLYAEKENERLYPASITKVMALILVMDALESGKIKLTDKVAASENAVSYGGSQIWLEVGEEMTVDDMLKAVVVASANDACTALGEFVSGSSDAFVAAMNKKAGELELKNTHFENCTGLDENEKNHYSSALDIALMSRELMRHELIRKYSCIWMDSLRGGKTELVNTNRLVRFYNGCIGLKTGTTTKAGFCVSAVAARDGTELCAVILGAKNSDERFNSAARLLDYGFANFETVSPAIDINNLQVKLRGGAQDSLALTLASEHPLVTAPKGSGEQVSTKIQLPAEVKAPVEKGQVIGTATFYLGEEKLGSVEIISASTAEKLTFWGALEKLLKSAVTNFK
ncbi:MAG: D-alanyl-D-alanine carboxypeptidase [Ruminococcaceae bacterium]|nr:D-alanyl-D-alanine carboxypeptidase [Oscillospiraceae bacterium]